MQRTSCLVLLALLCAAVVVSSYPVRDEGSCARRRHREQHHHDEYEQYGHGDHDEHEGYGHDGPYAELKKSDTAAQARAATSACAEADGHHPVPCRRVLDAKYSSAPATSKPFLSCYSMLVC